MSKSIRIRCIQADLDNLSRELAAGRLDNAPGPMLTALEHVLGVLLSYCREPSKRGAIARQFTGRFVEDAEGE